MCALAAHTTQKPIYKPNMELSNPENRKNHEIPMIFPLYIISKMMKSARILACRAQMIEHN